MEVVVIVVAVAVAVTAAVAAVAVVVEVNFISNSQYKNEILTNPNTTLLSEAIREIHGLIGMVGVHDS